MPDVVNPQMRAVLDALQPHEWWMTTRPDAVVVSLDGNSAIRITVEPAPMPATSPYDDNILHIYVTDATTPEQAAELADNWASMQDYDEYMLLDPELTGDSAERKGHAEYRVVIIDAR